MKYNLKNLKDDFYEEVNREWLEKAKIDDDKASVSGFEELSKLIEKKRKALTLELVKDVKNLKDKTLYNFVLFYKLLRGKTAKDKIGFSPIKKYEEIINSLSSYEDINKNYKKLLLNGFLMPIDFDVVQDFKDSSKQVLAMGSPSLILPEKSYYKNKKMATHLLTIWKNVKVKLLKLYGMEEEKAIKLVQGAINFDQSLIKMSKTAQERANYVASYNIFKIKDIDKKQKLFNLEKITKSLVKEDVETIIEDNPRFIKALKKIYNVQTFENFKSLMLVDFITSSMPLLSEEAREIAFEYNKAITGIKSMKAEEKYTIDLAISFFNMPFGIYFGKREFGQDAKKNVENMVDKMISIYKNRLEQNTWLGKETIQKAIIKLSSLKKMIGYPEKYEPYYDKFITTIKGEEGNILDNIINFKRIKMEYRFSQYLKPVVRDYWSMSPAVVNAYFHPFHNVIVFPAAILQKPFYSYSDYSSSQNYGSIGAVIAHEISHAFDNNGSQFDEKGNLNNWWTNEDRAAFNKKKTKVIKLFDGISLGENIGTCNGKLTVSENIADLGGLAAAYEAAKSEKDFDGKEFFISWASSWKGKYREQYQKLLLKSDVHAPGKLRANVQLQNHDAFYEFFDVKETDKMFIDKKKRTIIW
ncbi:M13 family metallopeptidase [Mycoplasma phocimorsus]|uniref:M13 family metallopeptidase n=1 Tax=Mycoplasma phocimorsus TaxID=3045839 RepID=UPI0024BF4E97|nr:M13 family metallopeptidase [Mycoplasma phocimorsus]MDJ1646907.1 M13 family metallopeptidase [Mycoplasma phocimorsus]